MKRYRNNHAFMLIEILVSILIVTIGIVSVMRAFSTTITAIKVSRGYLKASACLEERLWEFQERGAIGTDIEFEGSFDDEHLRWELETKDSGQGGVNLVNLTVFWKDRKDERSININTYLAAEEE
ncbi:MAG: type II secretion system protein [Candidatus Omnitrophica bacterium]|nr:type II secretion system protein [Candidatus Omnitrophota bacterium]